MFPKCRQVSAWLNEDIPAHFTENIEFLAVNFLFWQQWDFHSFPEPWHNTQQSPEARAAGLLGKLQLLICNIRIKPNALGYFVPG